MAVCMYWVYCMYPVWHLFLDTRLKPTIEMAGPVVNVTFLIRILGFVKPAWHWIHKSIGTLVWWWCHPCLRLWWVGSPILTLLLRASFTWLWERRVGRWHLSPHLHESMVAAPGGFGKLAPILWWLPEPSRPPGPGLEFHKGSLESLEELASSLEQGSGSAAGKGMDGITDLYCTVGFPRLARWACKTSD